jgi:hypothetical protein
MEPRRKRLVALAVVAAGWVLATWLVWSVVLAPREPEIPIVAFGDFLADVERGEVDDVHVKGRLYTYAFRLGDGRRMTKHATGPEPTLALVRSLRPKDSANRPPKVFFDDR